MYLTFVFIFYRYFLFVFSVKVKRYLNLPLTLLDVNCQHLHRTLLDIFVLADRRWKHVLVLWGLKNNSFDTLERTTMKQLTMCVPYFHFLLLHRTRGTVDLLLHLSS